VVETSRVRLGTSQLHSLRASLSLLLLLTSGYAVYAVDRTILSSVLAPLSSALSLTNSEIGLLSAAQYIGVTCTVFISGTLSEKYGRWKVILSGLVVFSSFTWLIGLSSSFFEAFLFRLVSGFGEGAFWPVAMAAVASFFSGRKGLALGIFYVGFDVGSVAGLSIGGVAYSIWGSWRPAFLLAPTLGIFVISGVILARRNFSESTDNSRGMIKLGSEAIQLLRRPNILLLMIFALLATWSSVWQVVFLPYYFFKVMDYTILSSAVLASLVTVAGAFGKVIIGGVSDRIKKNRLLLGVSIATLLSYALFFFATRNFFSDLVGALLMGFFSASIFPVLQAFVTDNSDGNTGGALGLSTSFQSVATIFSPVIASLLLVLGVGKAAAIDAMVPVALAVVVALFLRNSSQ
jgi:MFS family permease